MSTIAYKDGVVAADSRICRGSDIIGENFVKLVQRGAAVIGFVGNTAALASYTHYLDDIGYFTDGSSPEFYRERAWKEYIPTDEEAGELVVVFGDGIEVHSTYGVTKHELAPMAFGTGAPFALSGMELGLSAVQAVKHAAKFDGNTNTNTRFFELRMASND